MTTREAIDYIENYGWSKTRLGLDRTRTLLALMGNPQKQLRFIHVAGSNGKGSTCAMLDAILRAAGFRVGLYTSPYISDFCERIRVNGQNIPGEHLARITEAVRIHADSMADHPSQFELVTAIAMVYFYEQGCDLVVLETGMGGTLDSTNVIDTPEAALITNIGLEHTRYLGNTLSEIASAKAGIIKSGCECICYEIEPEALQVIQSVCADQQVPLTIADFSEARCLESSLDGQRFCYHGREYRLALLGSHQIRNAVMVLRTVEVLRRKGFKISDKAVNEGLRNVRWPARMEVLSHSPLFILDGGHNPQCAEALATSIRELLPDRQVVFVAGVLSDKDYPAILSYLIPLAQKFICLTPRSSRALPARELAAYLAGKNVPATACDDVRTGIEKASQTAGSNGCIVAFGSLYLAGMVRDLFI